MTVGERIKQRRKQLELSADDLAELIGVSRSTMFRYESGFIEKLPASALSPIANALHTTVEYLLGWTDEPFSGSDEVRNFTDEEQQLVRAYREAPEAIQQSVCKLLDIPPAIPAESSSSAG